MSIFEALGRQQREIEELFGDIRRALAASRHELARVTFQLISHKLICCMRAEHAVVYPRLADVPGLVAEVAQARREHAAIEQVINQLRVGGLRGLAWATAVDELATLVARHGELEELALFPIAGLALPTRELEKIDADFHAYLTWAGAVAGASITYELAPSDPPAAVVVRFRAA